MRRSATSVKVSDLLLVQRYNVSKKDSIFSECKTFFVLSCVLNFTDKKLIKQRSRLKFEMPADVKLKINMQIKNKNGSG